MVRTSLIVLIITISLFAVFLCSGAVLTATKPELLQKEVIKECKMPNTENQYIIGTECRTTELTQLGGFIVGMTLLFLMLSVLAFVIDINE
jgi:putative effector of murein hydrolase LrgA (UPF0299 family)